MSGWPVIRKEATYTIRASHHLRGVSHHPDADEIHEHDWRITLIWDHWEVSPERGFTRDESDIGHSFGARVRELEGCCLNDLMPVPPTSENLALWLLCFWMERLTPDEMNFELDAVRVAKCNTYTAEARRPQCKRREWREDGSRG
jgi:6-pyruvoyl-tetrahydropterin synthase